MHSLPEFTDFLHAFLQQSFRSAFSPLKYIYSDHCFVKKLAPVVSVTSLNFIIIVVIIINGSTDDVDSGVHFWFPN
jgi:hypothetical protein